MKTLVVIRHGKSSWDHPDLKDHHRPLIQRGVNSAFAISKELIRLGISPDLLLSSPAVRALDTAIIVATNMGYDLDKIATESTIYEATVAELMHVVASIPDEYQTLFIFGHNPGFTGLVNRLQSESMYNLPTCGTMAIELAIDSWSKIGTTSGKRLFTLLPKELV